MSDIDELLDELTGSGPEDRPDQPMPLWRRWSRGPVPVPAGVAIAVVAVLIGAVAVVGPGGDTATAGEEAAGEASDALGSAVATSVPGLASPAVDPPAGPTVTAETIAPASGVGDADNPDGAARYVVVTGGQAHLRGVAPSRAVADELVSAGTGVLGREAVVDEITVDPAAPPSGAVPIYFRDRILFDRNSIEVGADDLWMLDMAADLLAANPNLKLRIVARTDATGTDETNLDVAELRAGEVCNHLVARGTSPDQIILDPVGEADERHDGASDDDADTDRHVELIVEGSLTS